MSGPRSSRTETGRARALSRQGAALAAISLFALGTGVCAWAGLWALAAPTGPIAATLPLSPPHAALANRYLTPGTRPVDLDAAERETRWELALSPTTATAWLRLAYIDYWRHGRLTPAGMTDLRRSYEIAPLGPDATMARLLLSFELWRSTPPDMRAQALRELTALRERDRDATRAFADQIRSPEGRLAIGMAIAVLDSEEALKSSD